MKRSVVLFSAWGVCAIAVYLPFLLLDLEWNFANWKPVLNGDAVVLLAWIAVILAGCAWLSGRAQSRVVRWWSVVLTAGLLGVALYSSSAEPATHGLFERPRPSPTWYRCGRVVLMGLPLVFVLSCWNRRAKSERSFLGEETRTPVPP